MPSTPSFTHLSSMSVKERSPITSVQMESFMCLVLRDSAIYLKSTQTEPASAERTQFSSQRTPSVPASMPG